LKLLVVIVNYRCAALTCDALRSLAEEVTSVDPCRVVVVDNGSGDDSLETLREFVRANQLSSFCSIVDGKKNGGFSYGNNVGIRAALASDDPPEYVLLLNPDTIVRPEAFARLVEFMDLHPEVGIAGSRLEDPDGTPQRSVFRFPSILSEFEGTLHFGPVTRLLSRWTISVPVPSEAIRTDWVAGASMIIRRSVFDQVGLLDESYFMYFEEVDFCLQAAKAGWPCWYVPTSRVVHLVGQVSQVTDPKKSRRRRPTYWFESRRRYFLKNHGPTYALAADAAWLVGQVLFEARCFVQRKVNENPARFIPDFVMQSSFVKGLSL
jgi:GT2 family glycosyltransferase